MRSRLEGTEAEITAFIYLLGGLFKIHEASDFYPNRRRGAKYLPPAADPPVVGRVYLTLDAPPDLPPNVRAEAERADRLHQLPPARRKEIP